MFLTSGSFCPPKGANLKDNLTLHLNQLEKEQQQQQKTPKVSRRIEIIKVRSEINEKEMKETIAKINKIKSGFFEKIKDGVVFSFFQTVWVVLVKSNRISYI